MGSVVEPFDVDQGGQFDVVGVTPWSLTFDKVWHPRVGLVRFGGEIVLPRRMPHISRVPRPASIEPGCEERADPLPATGVAAFTPNGLILELFGVLPIFLASCDSSRISGALMQNLGRFSQGFGAGDPTTLTLQPSPLELATL